MTRIAARAQRIDVHFAARKPWVPSAARLRRWAGGALAGRGPDRAAVSVRVVGLATSRALNGHYRGKDAPTNVLSFAGAGRSPSGVDFLGELVICAPVLAKEARQQHKALPAHWAHITIHGVLHLLGFDHIKAGQAERWSGLKRKSLKAWDFPIRTTDSSILDPHA